MGEPTASVLGRRCLLVIGAASERIRDTAPGIKDVLEGISGGNCQLAYASHDGASFGFLLSTRLTAAQIINRLESPSPDGTPPEKLRGSSLQNDDEVLVLELGDDYFARRLGRAMTWLQRNPT